MSKTFLARTAATATLLTLLSLFANAALAADTPEFLDQYRGKVVLVDFWASWCVPCRRSVPWLNDMQEKYADDGLVVIGVNEDNDQADAAEFLEAYPARFHIIPDPDGKLATRFQLLAMPTSYLIGRDGSQLANHLGFKVADVREYENLLREALGLQPDLSFANGTLTGDQN